MMAGSTVLWRLWSALLAVVAGAALGVGVPDDLDGEALVDGVVARKVAVRIELIGLVAAGEGVLVVVAHFYLIWRTEEKKGWRIRK